MCIWNTERIVLDINCQVFKSIRSNEIVLKGLLAFNLYNFYVTAQNPLGSSEETLFQVFSGPGSLIGSPGPESPETIVTITITVTLLLIILIDVILCVFLKTGIICFLIHTCFFATVLGPQKYVPLKEQSEQKVEYQSSYVPVLEKDEEAIAATPLLVEYQQYQELSPDDVLFQTADIETDTQVLDIQIPQIRNYKFTIEERRKKNDSERLGSNADDFKALAFPKTTIPILKEGVKSKDGQETPLDRPLEIAIENSRKEKSKYPTNRVASPNSPSLKAVYANDELFEKSAGNKEPGKTNKDDKRWDVFNDSEFEARFEGNGMLV
ncbi:hypothetical protein RF11_11013 [Thelohanellus kitauei]|uniref:Uncharacterized protein n=1 Tax=Thelohanellus kitauei TaxID=669202 RepID=A0A0C2NBK2_THEKT|nr:hypothetical protein RF11_11013 [Thelohanellus kitauei]